MTIKRSVSKTRLTFVVKIPHFGDLTQTNMNHRERLYGTHQSEELLHWQYLYVSENNSFFVDCYKHNDFLSWGIRGPWMNINFSFLCELTITLFWRSSPNRVCVFSYLLFFNTPNESIFTRLFRISLDDHKIKKTRLWWYRWSESYEHIPDGFQLIVLIVFLYRFFEFSRFFFFYLFFLIFLCSFYFHFFGRQSEKNFHMKRSIQMICESLLSVS